MKSNDLFKGKPMFNITMSRVFLLFLSLVSFESFGVPWLVASSLSMEIGTTNAIKHGTILNFGSRMVDLPTIGDKNVTCQQEYSNGCVLGWYMRSSAGTVYRLPVTFTNDNNPWIANGGFKYQISLNNGAGTYSFNSLASSQAYTSNISQLNTTITSEWANSVLSSTVGESLLGGCAFFAMAPGGISNTVTKIDSSSLIFPPGVSTNSYCIPIPPVDNKCQFSTDSLNVDFGNITLNSTSSASVEKEISITCTLDSTVQFSGESSIPLSNGMQSIIKIDGNDMSSKSLSASGGVALKVPLDFSLSGTPVAGSFSGSSVLYINIL